MTRETLLPHAGIPAPAFFSTGRGFGAACVLALVAALSACGGGGGGDDDDDDNPPPSGGPFAITGKAVFASVPAQADGTGLNYGGTTDKPIRGATVQLLDAGNAVLATTATNETGDYSVSLTTSQAVRVRVRAEIKRTGTTVGDRDLTVVDNTSSGALYTLDSAAFTPTADTTQNLRAASGWGTSSYTGTRAAGPFAILDVIYSAQARIQGAAPVNLPALKLNWSINNQPVGGSIATGNIGTSFFQVSGGVPALYLLGKENVDTDEYDTHVVAHEFGHYLQYALSRDDSVGGAHGGDDKLDMRVAFSEGWGNAWSGIALADPRYTDSLNNQQSMGFFFDVSQPDASQPGWYSESAVQYLIYTANTTTGFTATYTALASLRTSPVFTSIFSYGTALRAASAANAGAVTALYATQGTTGTDAVGSGETNNGGNAANLPVYKTHTAALGATQNYCVRKENDPDGDGNKLGEHVFIRFTVATAGSYTLTATKTASPAPSDPDFSLVRADGTGADAFSGNVDVETLTITLPTGTHSIALTDFNLPAAASLSAQSCFDFKVQ